MHGAAGISGVKTGGWSVLVPGRQIPASCVFCMCSTLGDFPLNSSFHHHRTPTRDGHWTTLEGKQKASHPIARQELGPSRLDSSLTRLAAFSFLAVQGAAGYHWGEARKRAICAGTFVQVERLE